MKHDLTVDGVPTSINHTHTHHVDVRVELTDHTTENLKTVVAAVTAGFCAYQVVRQGGWIVQMLVPDRRWVR